MNKVGLGVGLAAVVYISTGYVYRGAEYAAIGPIQIDTDAVKAILTIIAFFVPMIVSQFSPALGVLLKKIFDQFLSKSVTEQSLVDLLDHVNGIGTVLAARGDKIGVKHCCNLHDHLLNRAAADYQKPECNHDHDES